MSAPTRQRKPLGVRQTLSDLAFVFELRPCANRGENSGRFTNDIARSRRRWRPRPGPHRRDSVADRKRLRHPLDRGLLHGRDRRRNLRYEQTRSLYRVGVGARAHAGSALARSGIRPHGLFKGERIIGVLRKLIGDFAIEDLPVSFTAVATDLESGEEVWLREGKLFDAIRASIATPLIFTPFQYGSRRLLDGALVNPVPIAPTLNDTTELTVAVNLSGPIELRPSPLPSASIPDGNAYRKRIGAFIESLHLSKAPAAPAHGIFDIAFASMEAMQNTIARLLYERLGK